jgi:hypothetical protein
LRSERRTLAPPLNTVDYQRSGWSVPSKSWIATARISGDDVADGRGALRAVEPQTLQPFDKTNFAHHRQPDVLHTHRARLKDLQRVGIDRDKATRCLHR